MPITPARRSSPPERDALAGWILLAWATATREGRWEELLHAYERIRDMLQAEQ